MAPKGVLEKNEKGHKNPFPPHLVKKSTLSVLKFFISFQNTPFDF
jgi:hypothetical protein